MSEHQGSPGPDHDPPMVHEVSHPRHNGWSCPWHPFQLIAWFFILLFTVAHYGILAFYVPGLWRIAAYAIPGIVLLVHIIANIVTTSINPAEPAILRKLRSGRRLRPIFDRSVHKHVIEDRHCHLCEIDVSSSAKHCRLCDKCVMNFDHHCKWLNNCVGAANYRWFLTTIFSGLLGAVMLLLYNLALFILFFADRDSLRYNCGYPSNTSACDETLRVFGGAVPDPVFPTLTAILGVLACIAVLLLGHLSAFHVYLISKGLTTYDYIVLQREKDQEGNAAGPERGYHGRCGFLRRKLNRIRPSSPMDEEQSIGSGDADSVGSSGSAGMANFGRTPSPSAGSEESVHDNRTDEQKLEAPATAGKEIPVYNNGNCAEATVDVTSPPVKKPVSILRVPKANDKLTSPPVKKPESILQVPKANDKVTSPPPVTAVVSNGTETAINMEDLDEQPPVPHSGARLEKALQREVLDDDLQDCGILASMAAANSEEIFEHTMDALNAAAMVDDMDCSTLAAMVVSNSVVEEEVDVSGGASGKSWKAVMIRDSPNKAAQTLEDRHTQLKAQTEQQMFCAESWSMSTSPKPISQQASSSSGLKLEPSLLSTRSNGSQCSGSLTTYPVSDSTISQSPKCPSVETLQRNAHADSNLQEIPLKMLQFSAKHSSELAEIDETPATDDRPVSPIVKKVSFQDFEKKFGMQPDAVSGRPLRPLPPIGTDPTAISEPMDELNWLSHKGLINNRPLPPLGRSYEEMVGSHDSLLSGSSQLLPQCGSVNSLPVPDPRYRRGILPKLSGASNLSLDAYPAAAGGRKKKKETKRKAAGKKPLPEQLREVYPPPFPSPEY